MKKFHVVKMLTLSLMLCLCLLSQFFASPFSIAEQSDNKTISDVTITGLQTENMTNPLGIDITNPSFSWKMESNIRGQYQTAYRIIVAKSEEELNSNAFQWDSGKQEGSESAAISYEGAKLQECTRYYWQVEVWDKDNLKATSDIAYFETGLMDSGWSEAEWIGRPSSITADENEGESSTITTFTIDVDFIITGTCFGFIFGATDENNFFMWQIKTDALNPHIRTNGSWYVPYSKSLSDSGVTVELNTQAHLKIEVAEGTVSTYINGILVDTYSVGYAFALAKIGIREEGEWESAAIDNIVIKDSLQQIVLEEDFSNANNNIFSAGVIENSYLLAASVGIVLQNNTIYNDEYTFSIDCDFIIDKGSFGLIFGATDENSYYWWQVCADTYVDNVTIRPHRFVSGDMEHIADISVSKIYPFKTDILGAYSHISIKVTKGYIETYLNSVLVDSRYVKAFKCGGVGFYALGSLEEFRADNLVVSDKNNEILKKYTFNSDTQSFNKGIVKNGMLSATNGTFFPKDTEIDISAPMLRREFALDKQIKRARLYVTSAGIYEMYINGEQVGDNTYLNPGSTQYDQTLLYQTYDVTNMIYAGDNVIGGVLGHGWFNRAQREYGATLALLAKLVITYADDTTKVIVTDENWAYFGNGPIKDDDLFMGEHYDATYEQEGWTTTSYDDSLWAIAGTYTKEYIGIGEICSQNMPQISCMAELSPVSITVPAKGIYIYDFGQNFAGIITIKAKGAKGQTMRIRYGEILNEKNMKGGDGAEGTLYTENLHSAKSTDYYIFKGDDEGEIFEPSLVYHGFRYVEITGIANQNDIYDVKGLVLYSALDETGFFESSNENVNKLYSNTLWSQRSNFMSIPTDCPQRDERWGWTGDAQIFALTASYNMNTYAFYRKYLKDMRDTQTADGKFLDATPGSKTVENGAYIIRNGNATSGWGDAGIIIPWEVYRQYGNPEIIYENYEAMCKWINYLENDAKANNYIRDKGWTGDWLSSGETTPFGVTDTAYCAYSAMLLSKMAKIIGEDEDALKYAEISQQFKEAWNREFVNSDGSTKCGTQTSYVLGLKFGLFADAQKSNAAKYLVDNIEAHGWKLTTGFLGVSYINGVLCDNGYEDVAFKLIEQTDYPSWLYSVTTGATTIWESWSAYRDYNDGTSSVSSESMNHYSYGAVCSWLYTNLSGISKNEDSVGFKSFILSPTIGGNFTYAKSTYISVYGLISSEWRLDNNGNLIYKATIPANTSATLYLPVLEDNLEYVENGVNFGSSDGVTYIGEKNGKAVYKIVSGSYSITVASINL